MAASPRPAAATDWPSYEGGGDAAHFSRLDQIDRTNVPRLAVAWRHDLGGEAANANPLVIDGTAYVIGGGGAIVAIDAASGKVRWTARDAAPRMRGLSYWRSAGGDDARLLFVRDQRLRALDARTGRPIAGFDVDLREGLGRAPDSVTQIQSSTPGRVFADLIILGSAPGEDYGSPPGDIRAYDVRSGKLAWSFKTIPDAGDPAAARTWGPNPRARWGGANDWSGIALDEARGIAFVVTGAPAYDFYGAGRPGDNLYANCIVALDARTGRRLWHFQTVHHDVWDYDLSATPVLLSVRHRGRRVDAVAVAGKTGYVYVFDRVTGAPLFPIPERQVPQDGLPGEPLSPTQPIPVLPPFARQRLTAADLDPALPRAEAAALARRLAAARNDGLFTPPSTRETVQMPGSNGGANWGGSAADPAAGLFYVYSFDVPSMTRMRLVDPRSVGGVGATAWARGQDIYRRNCAGCHGEDRGGQPPTIPALVNVTQRLAPEMLVDIVHRGRAPMPAFPDIVGGALGDLVAFLGGKAPAGGLAAGPARKQDLTPRWRTDYGYMISPSTGNPVIAPPWSTLTAYDLNRGTRLWQVPIGDDPAYALAGRPPTGVALTKLGVVVTGGGLIFAATSRDRRLLALDPRTGRTLWQADLPAAAAGIPATYAVGGRQYLLVPVAASGAKTGHERRDAAPARNGYVAFALPAQDGR